jgi:glutaredoxin
MSEVSITVYTRADCHLCSEAIETIERVTEDEDVTVNMDLIDVDTDPQLQSEYGDRVPYILISDTPAFKYRVDERTLRQKIREEMTE